MEGAPEPRAGTPLAGGWYAVLYVNKGDLEWMASHFGLARTTSRSPCILCRCSNLGREDEEFPWTDVNDPPSWERTAFTDEVCTRT